MGVHLRLGRGGRLRPEDSREVEAAAEHVTDEEHREDERGEAKHACSTAHTYRSLQLEACGFFRIILKWPSSG